MKTGIISGSLTPRTIMDNETGACKVSTPHSIFRDLKILDSNFLRGSAAVISMLKFLKLMFIVNGEFEDFENR